MKELILVVVGAALVNNIILSQFQDFVHSLVFPRKPILRQVWVWQLSSLPPCLLQ